MNESARRWRVLAGGVAVGVAGVISFADATATAEPVLPQPPAPTPPTVTQTVTVAPAAAPSAPVAANAQGATPGAAPDAVAAPGRGVAPRTATAADAPAAAKPAIVPATSGTLRDYFEAHNVRLEPQTSRGFTALNIVLPMPAGWSNVPDPNVPDAFAVIADRTSGGDGSYTSNASLVVSKLIGEFDPQEAISHGFVDSEELPAWRTTDASMGDFHGMPSALIEGTYRESSMALNTSRRHVIAASGPDKYLVSLAVTSTVDQAIASANATDAIVTGFRVSAPEPAPASPEPPPPPPNLPHLPGLPG